jgi:RNA 2',3'-cyclic 3'-phosphodiesterase
MRHAAQVDRRVEFWRLFTAAPVNDDVRALLADVRRQLTPLGWPVRWVEPALAHITLQFYGQTPPASVPALTAQLSDIARRTCPLTLTTGALGVFPSVARPRVIWLGLTGDLQQLHELAREVATTAALVPGADAKPFKPHITLGRVRERGTIQNFERAVAELDIESVPLLVTSIELTRSTLRAAGPTYTTLASLPLAGARPEVREHG